MRLKIRSPSAFKNSIESGPVIDLIFLSSFSMSIFHVSTLIFSPLERHLARAVEKIRFGSR